MCEGDVKGNKNVFWIMQILMPSKLKLVMQFLQSEYRKQGCQESVFVKQV